MKVSWESPANIALVKYWGKYKEQIPANPSISMSLSLSKTVTTVELCKDIPAGKFKYTYDGQAKKSFEAKIDTFFDRISMLLPFIKNHGILIDSQNNFPHSSGISSSASFYSSLALGLCDLDRIISGENMEDSQFLSKASTTARLGSGSAARSVYGNYALWGECELTGSSDKFAIPFPGDVHPVFLNYRDAVLIISSDPKPMSSSVGHELMNQNPYSKTRYKEAKQNIKTLSTALQNGDQSTYIDIVEHEALTLHGLILSSQGGSILMKPKTLEAIEIIQKFRRDTGSKCCFTLDAGPNIHLLYPNDEKEAILQLIKTKLSSTCEQGRWLDDSIGSGPLKHNTYDTIRKIPS